MSADGDPQDSGPILQLKTHFESVLRFMFKDHLMFSKFWNPASPQLMPGLRLTFSFVNMTKVIAEKNLGQHLASVFADPAKLDKVTLVWKMLSL